MTSRDFGAMKGTASFIGRSQLPANRGNTLPLAMKATRPRSSS
ncbi:Uncharacterised protein [Vibrio cholerae]|nr:Uncharacterised protein [Vibrio cholerae]